jgi:DNA-binding NarL/FixJ family response regulator
MHEETAENPIRLVLVDEQVLLRESVGRFLATQPGLQMAGECGTAAEALEILNHSSVDIVVSDVDLRTERGDDLISAARSAGYKGRFLIVAGAADAHELSAVIRRGASGIFLKSESADRLVQAIRLVASGAVWIDQTVIQLLADRLADRSQLERETAGRRLTDKEEKVILGILGGLTNRKIGEDIGISESAVKSLPRGTSA